VSTVDERISALLAEYTQRIIQEVKAELTDRVMAAFAGAATSPRTRPGAPEKARSAGRRRTRAEFGNVELGLVLDWIKANPDQSSGAIAQGLASRLPDALVKKALLSLRQSGQIAMTGNRRTATYRIGKR
jgi:hypothetical protein